MHSAPSATLEKISSRESSPGSFDLPPIPPFSTLKQAGSTTDVPMECDHPLQAATPALPNSNSAPSSSEVAAETASTPGDVAGQQREEPTNTADDKDTTEPLAKTLGTQGLLIPTASVDPSLTTDSQPHSRPRPRPRPRPTYRAPEAAGNKDSDQVTNTTLNNSHLPLPPQTQPLPQPRPARGGTALATMTDNEELETPSSRSQLSSPPAHSPSSLTAIVNSTPDTRGNTVSDRGFDLSDFPDSCRSEYAQIAENIDWGTSWLNCVRFAVELQRKAGYPVRKLYQWFSESC